MAFKSSFLKIIGEQSAKNLKSNSSKRSVGKTSPSFNNFMGS